MNRMIRHTAVILGLILAIFAVALYSLREAREKNVNSQSTSGENSTENQEEKPVAQPVTRSSHDFVISQLVNSNWSKDAAEAVWNINADYYDVLYTQLGEEVLDKDLYSLKRLGKPEYQDGIRRHPEMATLLGSVLDVDENGARNILKSLPNSVENYDLMVNLYLVYGSCPENASWLANIFQNSEYRDKMLSLLDKSFDNAELIVYFDMLNKLEKRSPKTAAVFKEWLFLQFDKILEEDTDSMESLHAKLQLTCFASAICRDLADEDFRDDFMRCWDVFESIVNEKMDEFKKKYFDNNEQREEACEEAWIAYQQDYNVFRFLHSYPEDGKELYRRYGSFACEWFLSKEFLNPQNKTARDNFILLLLNANDEQSKSFCYANISEHPAIIELLQRKNPVPNDILYKMFIKLANSAEPDNLVAYWMPMSNAALYREFNKKDPGLKQIIPGYDAYQLAVKCIDGRKVDGWDVGFATLDAACAVWGVSSFVKGLKVAKTTVKGAKTVAKKSVKTTLGKEISEVSLDKIAKEATDKTIRENASHLLKVLREISKKTRILKSIPKDGADITELTTYLLKKSGLKLQQFKDVTGLDARIFMRSDRKVVVKLGYLPGKEIAKQGAKAILISSIIDTTIYMGLSQPVVQTGIKTAITGATTNVPKVAERVKGSDEELWKKNVSLWWKCCQE